jgi:hypothetical protein
MSAPKVQLERLERIKQHKLALHSRNALPRLARLVDYIITCKAVATLDDGLAELRSLLTCCGVVRCCVAFNEDSSVLVEPAEAAVNLAVAKQVCARMRILLTGSDAAPVLVHPRTCICRHTRRHALPRRPSRSRTVAPDTCTWEPVRVRPGSQACACACMILACSAAGRGPWCTGAAGGGLLPGADQDDGPHATACDAGRGRQRRVCAACTARAAQRGHRSIHQRDAQHRPQPQRL